MNKNEVKKEQLAIVREVKRRSEELIASDHGLINCRAKIDAMQAIIDAPDKFEPEKYSPCWENRASGSVSIVISVENWRLQGNEWPTERLAKIASLRQKIQNYQAHYALQHCPDFKPDFSDVSRPKYLSVFNGLTSQSGFGCWYQEKASNAIYFPTPELARAAGEVTREMEIELAELVKGE